MGKRIKIAQGLGDFVPLAINFSKLELELKDSSIKFDIGDNGKEKIRLEENMAYEELVIQILCNLKNKEKLVFAYQLLRDAGFQIDHGSFAKTMNLTRRQYGLILEDVRLKASLFTIGYMKSRDLNRVQTKTTTSNIKV